MPTNSFNVYGKIAKTVRKKHKHNIQPKTRRCAYTKATRNSIDNIFPGQNAMIWKDILKDNNFRAKQFIIKTNTPNHITKFISKSSLHIKVQIHSIITIYINLRDVFICKQMQQTENPWKRSISIPSRSADTFDTNTITE